MIKKETILSVFDKKLTLLEYLKEIKKGLEDSAIESFSCDQVDETHVKFALNFADGTAYETDAIEVPTGPQGETGATPQIEVSVSAETLAPNESATASVTQGGTAEEPTIAIAFGIPKGDKGDGASIYMHIITFNTNKQKVIIYNASPTPFTFDSLHALLITTGSISAYGEYTATNLFTFITSVKRFQTRIVFNGYVYNQTTNVLAETNVDCYSSAFTSDVVIEL